MEPKEGVDSCAQNSSYWSGVTGSEYLRCLRFGPKRRHSMAGATGTGGGWSILACAMILLYSSSSSSGI